MVKTWPSNAHGVGSIPGPVRELKMVHIKKKKKVLKKHTVSVCPVIGPSEFDHMVKMVSILFYSILTSYKQLLNRFFCFHLLLIAYFLLHFKTHILLLLKTSKSDIFNLSHRGWGRWKKSIIHAVFSHLSFLFQVCFFIHLPLKWRKMHIKLIESL